LGILTAAAEYERPAMTATTLIHPYRQVPSDGTDGRESADDWSLGACGVVVGFALIAKPALDLVPDFHCAVRDRVGYHRAVIIGAAVGSTLLGTDESW